LSDPNGDNSAAPAEATVPKYRLDELIEQNRRAQAQIEALSGLVQRIAPVQNQRPPEDPPALRRLREENPEHYALLKAQEMKLQQQSAGLFMMNEELDRERFARKFGDDGANVLPQVEQELDRLRRQGVHGHTRESIFKYLKGEEAVSKKRAPAPNPIAEAPQTSAVPSSSTRAAATISGGLAPSNRSESLEELEARLADQEF